MHPAQIKVRVKAAGVNPVDTKLRKRGVFFGNALPAVLGCDGAGEVVETGSEAGKFKVGDRVWFCHGGLGGSKAIMRNSTYWTSDGPRLSLTP